jgi:hypothetical protein
MPAPAAPIIGGLFGLARTVTGAINNAKAKREAKRLEATRPVRETSDLLKQDLSQAESEASTGGLSAKAERAYNQLQDKQLATSLGAILKGGGSVNNVGDVFGAGEEGRLRLALLNDQMRMQKLATLSQSRNQMAEEEDKNFMFNTVAPWRDKAQAIAQARQQAQNDIWGGLGTVASQGMQFAGNQYNQKMYDQYFNNGNTMTNNSTFTPPGRTQVQLPTTQPSNMTAAPGLQSKLTYPTNDNVYSYNWTPEAETQQFQQDFGTLYQ